jgi:hypothetical protein
VTDPATRAMALIVTSARRTEGDVIVVLDPVGVSAPADGVTLTPRTGPAQRVHRLRAARMVG